MRDRKPSPRKLSLEQETTLGGFGNLLTGEPGESVLQTLVRLFGDAGAARQGWYDHRDALLAAYPTPGRRPAGFWLFELQREPPPTVEQAAILRQFGALTPAEEKQLEEWRRMLPETPADLAVDHPSVVIPILEEPPHAIDAPPEPPRPALTEAAGGSGAPAEDPEVEDPSTEHEHPKESVVRRPQILSMPWYSQNGRPRETEGWETHEP